MAEEIEYLWVRSPLPTLPDGGNKVVFMERDRAHPYEEAWVAGPQPVKVARTGAVEAALAARRIVEVKEADARRWYGEKRERLAAAREAVAGPPADPFADEAERAPASVVPEPAPAVEPRRR